MSVNRSDYEAVGRVKCRMGVHTPIIIPGIRRRKCRECNGTGYEPVDYQQQCVYCGDFAEMDHDATFQANEVLRETRPQPQIHIPNASEIRKFGGNPPSPLTDLGTLIPRPDDSVFTPANAASLTQSRYQAAMDEMNRVTLAEVNRMYNAAWYGGSLRFNLNGD